MSNHKHVNTNVRSLMILPQYQAYMHDTTIEVIDGAVLAPSWEPQEEGMMSTSASFPKL
jgi:hypothetical protein